MYDTKNLEKQLDASTSKYLKANTSYNKEKHLDGSLWWVGLEVILVIEKEYKNLSKFQIIPSNVKPDLSYKDYDWTIDLDNFFIETAVINTSTTTILNLYSFFNRC
jgi:hypothetical protein